MDTNYINIIKGAFIKNIIKIIVVGIVCSIALVCEKSFTTDFVVESGDLIQTKIIKVNDPNDSPLSDKSVDYRGIMYTNYNLDSLINDQKNSFRFDNLNLEWEKLSKIEKLAFLRKVIVIHDFRNGIYEIVLRISKDTPKNVDYLNANGQNFINAFVDVSNNTINGLRPGTQIEILSQDSAEPEYKPLPQAAILVKYGIVGFILGEILSFLVVSVVALGKKK